MKDRLIGLLDKVQLHGVDIPVDRERYPSDEVSVSNERIAEHLVDNGVTIRERGEWITLKRGRRQYCSRCHYPKPYKKIKAGYHVIDEGKFCPNCGAKMKGE